MKIIQHKNFEKMYKKLDKNVQSKFKKTLSIFIQDPFSSLLNNHKLNGFYNGFRSINITGDYRMIFRELSNGRYEIVELVKIGTHSQLY